MIIRVLKDDEAVVFMVDSNLQRGMLIMWLYTVITLSLETVLSIFRERVISVDKENKFSVSQKRASLLKTMIRITIIRMRSFIRQP